MMIELHNASDFLRKARKKLRFGEFSREPLQLLRLEWKVELLERDWLMRPADPFDSKLPRHLVDEHQTLQALRGALTLRDVVFKCFPTVNTAELRMFRTGADHRPELMMTGSVHRTNEVLPRVASVAMRARLCGFHFNLAQGVLEQMSPVPAACS